MFLYLYQWPASRSYRFFFFDVQNEIVFFLCFLCSHSRRKLYTRYSYWRHINIKYYYYCVILEFFFLSIPSLLVYWYIIITRIRLRIYPIAAITSRNVIFKMCIHVNNIILLLFTRDNIIFILQFVYMTTEREYCGRYYKNIKKNMVFFLTKLFYRLI